MAAQFPPLETLPPYNEDGVGGMHVYIPGGRQPVAGLPPRLPLRALGRPRHARLRPSQAASANGGGYGKKLKDDYRRLYGSIVGFSGRGEMIPNKDSYCELHPDRVDRFGIPVLRFHWKWSDAERPRHATCKTPSARSWRRWGARPSARPPRDEEYGLNRGRDHPRGGDHADGRNPRTSALNAWCQAHDA